MMVDSNVSLSRADQMIKAKLLRNTKVAGKQRKNTNFQRGFALDFGI